VLAYLAPVGCELLVVNNSRPSQEVMIDLPGLDGVQAVDLFTEQPLNVPTAPLRLSLEPYGYRWLSLSRRMRGE